MSWFSTLGNYARTTAQAIGKKASEVGTFLGQKVKNALPVIGDIANGIAKYAPVVADMLPVGGNIVNAVGRAAGWVGKNIDNGRAGNALEIARTGADVLAGKEKLNDAVNRFNKDK